LPVIKKHSFIWVLFIFFRRSWD